jgi:hypothetical protein
MILLLLAQRMLRHMASRKPDCMISLDRARTHPEEHYIARVPLMGSNDRQKNSVKGNSRNWALPALLKWQSNKSQWHPPSHFDEIEFRFEVGFSEFAAEIQSTLQFLGLSGEHHTLIGSPILTKLHTISHTHGQQMIRGAARQFRAQNLEGATDIERHSSRRMN